MTTSIDIEKIKAFYTEHYRQKDVTSEVEIAFGYVDYTNHPIIMDYEERGYILHDTFTFVHGEQWGELLVFVKKKQNYEQHETKQKNKNDFRKADKNREQIIRPCSLRGR